TGIQITSVNITRESPDLDVYSSSTACSGASEVALTREGATLNITAARLNPNSSFDPFPASVEECMITFKKAVEDPSSPILESLTIYPNCTIINGTSQCSVTLIDIQRKTDYWNAITGGTNQPKEYPTHYIAQYSCNYMNNLGKTGTFTTEYDFWLADFLVCS
ncbi:MAG: hypothetical protein AABY42_02695, partial [Nitrospirota bacterium]